MALWVFKTLNLRAEFVLLRKFKPQKSMKSWINHRNDSIFDKFVFNSVEITQSQVDQSINGRAKGLEMDDFIGIIHLIS